MLDPRTLALGGLLLGALSSSCAGEVRRPADCAPLADLAVMHQIGNAVRAAYPHDVDLKSPEAIRAADRIMVIDRRNTARLRPWLQRCGWPDVRAVGDATGGMVWSLVQHADQDRPFQQFAIDLLRRKVLEGGAPGAHLAYLEDRVAIGMGRPQRYGTQLKVKGACQFELLPLDSPAKVDERRKEVGMEPMAIYLAQVRSALLPASCKSADRTAP